MPEATRRSDLLRFVRSLRPLRTRHPLVRIGGPRDGGYLVPDDLDGIEACFSPGVGGTVRFEQDLLRRGIPSHLVDHTVGPPDPSLFDHLPLRLSDRTEGDAISLDDWVADRRPGDGDLLLQMDIEGAEWDVLPAVTPRTLARFRIVVIELHGLRRLRQTEWFERMDRSLAALRSGWRVVHLHPNNCCPVDDVRGIPVPRVLEVTFLRRDRAGFGVPVLRLPHALDAPNVAKRPPVDLPREWFGWTGPFGSRTDRRQRDRLVRS